MRIALLDPGGPHGLAASLEEAGDEVIVLGERSLPRVLTERRGYDERLGTVPAAVAGLLRGAFDAAQAFDPAGAWAAVAARRLGGPPFVFSLAEPPTREWLVARRYRLAMAVRAAAGADACSAGSPEAARAFRRYLLRDAVVAADFNDHRRLLRDVARG